MVFRKNKIYEKNGNDDMDDLRKLQEEVAEHLGIDPLPIKYEFLGDEDSRLYLKDEYVGINIKYKNDYLEYAKAITHEYRHAFQIFYASLYETELAKRWRKLLGSQINSSNMMEDGSDYINQELEIDAFAFTKFYLKKYKDIDVINKIPGLDDLLDLYIEKNWKMM